MMRPVIARALGTLPRSRIQPSVLIPERECYFMGVETYLRVLLGGLRFIIDRSPLEEAEYQWKATFLRDPT